MSVRIALACALVVSVASAASADAIKKLRCTGPNKRDHPYDDRVSLNLTTKQWNGGGRTWYPLKDNGAYWTLTYDSQFPQPPMDDLDKTTMVMTNYLGLAENTVHCVIDTR